MFWNRKTDNDKNLHQFAYSPYSLLKPVGYQIPKNMIEKIDKETEVLVKESIAHNLIDKFTPEEMQNDDRKKMNFLKRFICDSFEIPFIELERQKLVIERESIQDIKMLQKSELEKHKKLLFYAQELLEKNEKSI